MDNVEQTASEHDRPPQRSELPLTTVQYGEPTGTFTYEGSYVGVDRLPFEPTEAMGTQFEMDGLAFAIDGDLGGQVVYHRLSDPHTLYHMPWSTFTECFESDTIEVQDAV